MNIEQLKNEVKSEGFHNRLKELYVDPDRLNQQEQRYLSLLTQFEKDFDSTEVHLYSAPGRVEIGGNHTDHQHGKVLAGAINLDMIAVVSKRTDNEVHMKSAGFEIPVVNLDELAKKKEEEGNSAALIRGVCARLKESGYAIGGFNATMISNIPDGAGLSSSAAFEILIGTIVSGEFNQEKIDPKLIGQAGQYSENEYFNKPCGLMDQMASSIGGLITIDFQNPAQPEIHQVDYQFSSSSFALCIVDTKSSHADLTADYASILSEMKSVATYFGKEVLRDVDEVEFYQSIKRLREKLGDRAVLRAHHFFRENKCVTKQVASLEKKDFDQFRKLIQESGNSSYRYLQNIYSLNDIQNQSLAIGIAVSEKLLGDQGVVRVHGGGFAGTIQAFVPFHLLEDYKEGIEKVFGEGTCHALSIRPYGGTKVL